VVSREARKHAGVVARAKSDNELIIGQQRKQAACRQEGGAVVAAAVCPVYQLLFKAVDK
jgi:hypothetical protein